MKKPQTYKNKSAVIKVGLILCSLAMTACTTPAQQFKITAENYGFSEYEVSGSNFKHKVYLNKQVVTAQNKVLHVYLDGDGKPFKNSYALAADPTSRNHLILELMALDKQPAMMLGRPCYHGLSIDSSNCEYRLWTSARYSATVVDSMVTALNKWLKQHRFQKIVLIGFSGGGTLAVLMAKKLATVTTVVTLAANLDVAAWSQHHGYLMLKDSLSPMNQPILKENIKQLHLAGSEDEKVPPFIIKAYANKQKNALFRIYKGFTHHCCWLKIWSDILKEINNSLI